EHYQIGELARLDGALEALLEAEARVVDRVEAQRLLAADALVRAVDAIRDRVARDEVVHRPERVVRNHGRVRAAGDEEALVEERAHRRHLLGALAAPVLGDARRGEIAVSLS